MHYIIIQVLEVLSVFVFCTIGINLIKKWQKTVKGRTICVGISILCFLFALLSAIYFVYDIFFLNAVGDFPVIKLFLFIVAIIIYIGFVAYSICERFKTHGISTTMVLAALMAAAATVIYIGEDAEIHWNETKLYNSKVISQSPKIVEEKFELIALADNTNLEGTLSGNISGNRYRSFFVARETMQGSQNGEIKNVDVYKLYYVADNTTRKILSKTLYAEQTPIYPLKEGETPYLLKITSTPYSLDYNIEPAKECNYGESTVTYELHIPETAILHNFVLDGN